MKSALALSLEAFPNAIVSVAIARSKSQGVESILLANAPNTHKATRPIARIVRSPENAWVVSGNATEPPTIPACTRSGGLREPLAYDGKLHRCHEDRYRLIELS